jgi:hypothetical protein
MVCVAPTTPGHCGTGTYTNKTDRHDISETLLKVALNVLDPISLA